MDIQELLALVIKNKASDLHLLSGVSPAMRIDGSLSYLSTYPALTPQSIETIVFPLLTPEQKDLLHANKELDFSYSFTGAAAVGSGRFRVNLYFAQGHVGAEFRFLPFIIPPLEEIHLPKICHTFTQLKQGFVLVTGPTGHGKSTAVASMINEINMQRAAHILTIEDPVEYIYPKGQSIVSQREMDVDTHSWNIALRSALREDPDVVMVGEMRDAETIAAAITIAETGHLVFSTLHTNSAAQSIDRIIDAFPANQQVQIRTQLALTLKGIISARLIPQINGGRIRAAEVLLGTNAVASNIREGKTHLIDSIIQSSQDIGMIPLENSLAQLVSEGMITLENAQSYALHPEVLTQMLK